jgi:hypothetical protein
LAEADLDPDSMAGISIGAINAALIAGNEPEARVDRLRAFRERITGKPYCDWSERLFSGKSDAVLHLIYRAKDCEGHSKDYRFSSASMQERAPAITTPFAPCAIRSARAPHQSRGRLHLRPLPRRPRIERDFQCFPLACLSGHPTDVALRLSAKD